MKFSNEYMSNDAPFNNAACCALLKRNCNLSLLEQERKQMEQEFQGELFQYREYFLPGMSFRNVYETLIPGYKIIFRERSTITNMIVKLSSNSSDFASALFIKFSDGSIVVLAKNSAKSFYFDPMCGAIAAPITNGDDRIKFFVGIVNNCITLDGRIRSLADVVSGAFFKANTKGAMQPSAGELLVASATPELYEDPKKMAPAVPPRRH